MELSLAASRYCGSKSGRSVTVWKNDFESMLFIHPCHVATHEGTFFSERLVSRLESVSCSGLLEPLANVLTFSQWMQMNHHQPQLLNDVHLEIHSILFRMIWKKNMDLIIKIDMPRTSIDFLSRFWGLERGSVLEVLPPPAASDATSVRHQGLGRRSWSSKAPKIEGIVHWLFGCLFLIPQKPNGTATAMPMQLSWFGGIGYLPRWITAPFAVLGCHVSVEVSFALHHGSRCFACRIERQLREQFLSEMDQLLDECHPTLCLLDDLFVLDISKNPASAHWIYSTHLPPKYLSGAWLYHLETRRTRRM